MIEIVADAGGDQAGQVQLGQVIPQATTLNEHVHHLGDAEAMAEVVERIIAVRVLHVDLQVDQLEPLMTTTPYQESMLSLTKKLCRVLRLILSASMSPSSSYISFSKAIS